VWFKSKKRKKSGAAGSGSTGRHSIAGTSGGSAVAAAAAAAATSTNLIYNSYATPFQSDDEGFSANGGISSDYEDDPQDAPFAFRRKANVQYLAPKVMEFEPSTSPTEDIIMGMAGSGSLPHPAALPNFNVLNSGSNFKVEPRFRYYHASLSNPQPRFLGRIRRRVGRGGRCVLDRIYQQIHNGDLANLGIINSEEACVRENLPHFRPVTPPHVKEETWDLTGQFNDALSFPSKPVRMPASTSAPASSNSSLIERHRSISGMGTVKTVSVDSVGAQNAASLVSNNLIDIFGK